MYAFGSSITSRFNPETSDIDLIVEVEVADPADRGETLLSLWDQLEFLFERRVDLLTEASIKNPYLKKTIDHTKMVIYDRSREEVIV
jgi:predicted nucleotidyltransferase